MLISNKMGAQFNEKQLDKLANLSFDLAKGIILGSVGLSITTTLQNGVLLTMGATIIAIGFVRMGLTFLK